MKLHPPTPIGQLAVGVPFVKENRTYYRALAVEYGLISAFEVINSVVQFKVPKCFGPNDLVQPLILPIHPIDNSLA